MTWFAAHVIMYVEYKNKKQKYYPVWENIYLIEASSVAEVENKACLRGKEGEGDADGTFEWNGNPARWIFAGIRKIIECQNSPEVLIQIPLEDRPCDGTEITYSQFILKDKKSMEKLINGESVEIIYEE